MELRWDGGSARFTVELADTPETREKGLMFREHMASSAGMLFEYQSPQHARFWMHNTLIPLDMVFVDLTGTVTKIHPDAKPQDDTSIDGGEGVLYVLEINGGLAKRLGLVAGAEMKSSIIDQDNAVWTCNAE